MERPELDSLWDHVLDAVTLAISRGKCPKMAPPRAEYPLISGVEHVGMDGVDGGNV